MPWRMLAAKGCQLVDWLVACQYGTLTGQISRVKCINSVCMRMLHWAVYSTCGFLYAFFDRGREGSVWWDSWVGSCLSQINTTRFNQAGLRRCWVLSFLKKKVNKQNLGGSASRFSDWALKSQKNPRLLNQRISCRFKRAFNPPNNICVQNPTSGYPRYTSII